MRTRAAVATAAGKPLEIMDVNLDGPRAGEVLVEIKATGICHTDEFTLSGADPEGMLRRLCTAISLAFDPAMLSWPAGGHPDDGVWAAHWYGAIHQSTGFAGPEGPLPKIPADQKKIFDPCLAAYEALVRHKI